MKLIVNLETGVVFDANNCVMIDTERNLTEAENQRLDGDDYFDDAFIYEIAKQRGRRIPAHDLTWGNTISFSPMALRDEAEVFIDGGHFPPESDQFKAMKWVLEIATDDDLEPIAGYILSDDRAWAFYKEAVVDSILDRYMETITDTMTTEEN